MAKRKTKRTVDKDCTMKITITHNDKLIKTKLVSAESVAYFRNALKSEFAGYGVINVLMTQETGYVNSFPLRTAK